MWVRTHLRLKQPPSLPSPASSQAWLALDTLRRSLLSYPGYILYRTSSSYHPSDNQSHSQLHSVLLHHEEVVKIFCKPTDIAMHHCQKSCRGGFGKCDWHTKLYYQQGTNIQFSMHSWGTKSPHCLVYQSTEHWLLSWTCLSYLQGTMFCAIWFPGLV